MKTTVTPQGQTEIPADIRQKYGIDAGSRLEWVDEGQTIRVIPILTDPVDALCGSAKGSGLFDRLMEERTRDRAEERAMDEERALDRVRKNR